MSRLTRPAIAPNGAATMSMQPWLLLVWVGLADVGVEASEAVLLTTADGVGVGDGVGLWLGLGAAVVTGTAGAGAAVVGRGAAGGALDAGGGATDETWELCET